MQFTVQYSVMIDKIWNIFTIQTFLIHYISRDITGVELSNIQQNFRIIIIGDVFIGHPELQFVFRLLSIFFDLLIFDSIDKKAVLKLRCWIFILQLWNHLVCQRKRTICIGSVVYNEIAFSYSSLSLLISFITAIENNHYQQHITIL